MSKLPEPVAWFRTEMYESCPMTFYYESHCHEDLEPLYPESAVTALQSRITELEAAVIAMRDEGLEKIMAMSEDQAKVREAVEILRRLDAAQGAVDGVMTRVIAFEACSYDPEAGAIALQQVRASVEDLAIGQQWRPIK